MNHRRSEVLKSENLGLDAYIVSAQFYIIKFEMERKD